MIQSRAKAIIVTLVILFGMSFGTVLAKKTYTSVSPATFLYMCLLIGMATMALYTFAIRRERVPWDLMTPKIWVYVFEIAFFNFVTGTLILFSLQYMPATTNTYITNFIGFITMGMSIVILKEHPSVFQVLGAVIAFSGLRMFFPELPKSGEMLGIVMILIAITGIAFTNNIARKLAIETENRISNNIISTLAILIGGSIAVVIYVAIDGFPPVVPTLADWGVILYTGIFSRAIGLTAWNLILRTLRSYEASILGASTVIWTSLLAVLILKETLMMHQIFAISMMLVGLALVQVRSGSFGSLLARVRR